MALMLASVFIGFLWGIGLLAVAERLVAWRWPANKRNRKENKKRKKRKPPQDRRVSPGAFLEQGSCGLDFAQPPDATLPELNIVQMAGEEGWVDGR